MDITTVRQRASFRELDKLIDAARKEPARPETAGGAKSMIKALETFDKSGLRLNAKVLRALGASPSEQLEVLFARLARDIGKGDLKVDLSPEASCANVANAFDRLLSRTFIDYSEVNFGVAQAVSHLGYEYNDPDAGREIGKDSPIPYWNSGFALGDVVAEGEQQRVDIKHGIHGATTQFKKDGDGEWRGAQWGDDHHAVNISEMKLSDLKALDSVLRRLEPKSQGGSGYVAALAETYGAPSPFADLKAAVEDNIASKQADLTTRLVKGSAALAKALGGGVRRLPRASIDMVVGYAPSTKDSPELQRYR